MRRSRSAAGAGVFPPAPATDVDRRPARSPANRGGVSTHMTLSSATRIDTARVVSRSNGGCPRTDGGGVVDDDDDEAAAERDCDWF